MTLEGGSAVGRTGLAGAIAEARKRAYPEGYDAKKDVLVDKECKAIVDYINSELSEDGKVLVSDEDSSPDFLVEKIVAPLGNPITVSEVIVDGKHKVQIMSTGGGGDGEVNTASNIGTAGVGLYEQKVGVDLEFKNIKSSTGKITVTDSITDHTVDLGINITTADVSVSTNKNYVTDAQLTVISNTSGANTGDQTLPIDATIVTTDITTNNATTSKHGWLLKATAPAANQLNVVGITNGETSYSNKTILGTSTPSTQALGDSASSGTSLEASRSDHKHAMPANTFAGKTGTFTDNTILRSDSTTGTIQTSGITIDDSNNIAGAASVTVTSLVTPSISLTTTLGANNTAAGIYTSATVDTNATGLWALLYLASDGHYDEADADSATTMPGIALALETGTGTKNILLWGYARYDTWNWTPGGMVFADTTTGAMTQAAPSGAADIIQVVGIALTADILFFNPQITILEHG